MLAPENDNLCRRAYIIDIATSQSAAESGGECATGTLGTLPCDIFADLTVWPHAVSVDFTMAVLEGGPLHTFWQAHSVFFC